jgi:predicted MFS family arabinose efflux permease
MRTRPSEHPSQSPSSCLAAWTGRKAGQWGRKPLLLVAFGVLPVRAVLYTLTNSASALVAIQVLDGVAAGIFGVVSLAAVASVAFAILYFFVPETHGESFA